MECHRGREAARLSFAFSGESEGWLHLVPGICGNSDDDVAGVCVCFFVGVWFMMFFVFFFSIVFFNLRYCLCLCLFQCYILWVSVLFFLVQRCFFDVLNVTIIYLMQWFSYIMLFSSGLSFLVIQLLIILCRCIAILGVFIYLLSVVFLPRGWIFKTLQCVWIHLLLSEVLSDVVLKRTPRKDWKGIQSQLSSD